MTSERRLHIGDEVIRYSLKRSGRRKKTVGIRVAQVGLEVAAPTRTSIREIEEILQKRAQWILEKMVAASQLPQRNQLSTGEILPLMGREVTLIVEQSEVGRAYATTDGGQAQGTASA